MQHFLDLFDISTEQIQNLLADALAMKAVPGGQRTAQFAGRVLGLVFEKPSLRTRVSFEAAMAHLGGTSIFLSATDGAMGQRESVPDFARVLSQFVDVAVLRVFSHATVVEFAQHASIPVISGLSDLGHPCQVLGDLLTIQEAFGDIKGRTVVFVGDGNNVARSLAVGCGKLGARFILSAPRGFGFDDEFLNSYRQQLPDADVEEMINPQRAVASADIVYCDVWTSMGQESEHTHRLQKFAGYQVNEELLVKAPERALVMHCLPAHRGEEISAETIDGPRSLVFQQAGNRMHAQKAILKWLLS